MIKREMAEKYPPSANWKPTRPGRKAEATQREAPG